MDRSKLKTYAPQARKAFIEAVKARAALFDITEKGVAPATIQGDMALIQGQAHPRSLEDRRQRLAGRIQREGFEFVMDAVAYTWFNRLAALRYMELHGYLDHGYRVLSHPEGKPIPEILEHAEHVDLPGLKAAEVVDLKLEGKEQDLYRRLLVAQCNALHKVMPFLFGAIEDETELLLPDNLLHSGSVLRELVESLDPESCENVEVLGWLYQFYIADKKDAVMARKSAVPTEDIPAVTQLFTPHWIVRYLVENSLGRLWLLNRPGSRLKEYMPYYIEGQPETDFLRIEKPEDIRLLDPACGSGHILTYAFDLLYLIYEEAGYAPNEIPAFILKHNLHGLEICPRATQLAGFALVMKAREKSRRFLQPERIVQPTVLELQNVCFEDGELHEYIHALGLGDLFSEPLIQLLHQFKDAKTFGSLIQPCMDEQAIADVKRAIDARNIGSQIFLIDTHQKVLGILSQADLLTQNYQVVVANPPYLGIKGMNGELKAFAQSGFNDSKSDLFAMFIERGFTLVVPGGMNAMVTMQSWMFLSSYENFRNYLLKNHSIRTFIQIGYNSFPEMNSKVAQACAFIIKVNSVDTHSYYINLNNANQSADKESVFLEKIHTKDFVLGNTNDFLKIPGNPIAFSASKAALSAFTQLEPLDKYFFSEGPCKTGCDDLYLRFHWEVPATKIGACNDWCCCSKGGAFRKSYGNIDYVILWTNKAQNHYHKDPIARISPKTTWDIDGVTWTIIGSKSSSSFRILPRGVRFNSVSPTIFPKPGLENQLASFLAFLNSSVASYFLELMNPTLALNVGNVLSIPVSREVINNRISCDEILNIAKNDWDNFETSRDFVVFPLFKKQSHGLNRPSADAAISSLCPDGSAACNCFNLDFPSLPASWASWRAICNSAIRRMQELETENNRLFIEAYGLQDELTPEVPEDQITLARADAAKDTGDLLSYALGCMMGRYSLDKPGLIYAHAGNEDFDPSQYATFPADEDGIVPVTEFPWFPDDAALRFETFLKTAWSPDTLEENLTWVAEQLGPKKDETARETIRRYFATGFYKDHLQTYKKRPIYWLFSSGKERAFQALVYLHRYHEGTLARMRTEYVIPLQGRIGGRIDQLREDIARATSAAHGKKLQKELDTLRKQEVELRAFDEQLRHFADQRISPDLDDGVKKNYGKFGDLLANVKEITGGKDED